MKSGNLNFLEPSGPLQACNGTALHFLLLLYHLFNVFTVGLCLSRYLVTLGMFGVSVEHIATVFRFKMSMNICGYMVKTCGLSDQRMTL